MNRTVAAIVVLLAIAGVSKCNEDESKTLRQQLLGISLSGQWKMDTTELGSYKVPVGALINLDKMPNSMVFKNGSIGGELEVQFYFSFHEEEYLQIKEPVQTQHATDIYIQLYESKYRNEKVIVLDIDVHSMWNRSANGWNGKNIALATIYMQYDKEVIFETEAKITIIRPINENHISISFQGESISFTAKVQQTSYSHSYFLVYLGLCLLQAIMLFVYFPEENAESRAVQFRTSEWLLLHSIAFYLFNAVICVLSIAVAKSDTQLAWFFMIAFLNCALALMMMRKFEPVFKKFTEFRKLLVGLLFIAVYQLLAFNFFNYGFFWVMESMIFLWQITYSMSRGGKGGLPIQLVLVILISRVPLLFKFLVENNIFRERHDRMVVAVIFATQLLHLLIIFLQTRLGGRFFILKEIIPDFYSYKAALQAGNKILKEECLICISQLGNDPDEVAASEGSSSIAFGESRKEPEKDKEKKVLNEVRLMKTPCDHYYHSSCLMDWMQNKLVCPKCRRQLPPLNSMK